MFSTWWKWALFIGLVMFCSVFYALSVNTVEQNRIETQTEEFKTSIHVKILTELKKGPFLHRIIDEELNKVCYVNAVGGGIQCFSLLELTSHMTRDEFNQLTRVNEIVYNRNKY
jgi:hypothetical protein